MSTTYEEILSEQPSLKKTAEYIEKEAPVFADALKQNVKKVIYVGCGSSYMLACGAASMHNMHLSVPAIAVAGGDLMIHFDAYRAMLGESLVVAISRSGSTSEVVKSYAKIKEAGIDCKLMAISCVDGAPLSLESEIALEMPWAYDVSICQTRNVSCLYLSLLLLIAAAAGDEEMKASALEVINGLDEFRKRWEPSIVDMAARPWRDGCVLGDAEICGVADEAALTFKEICQLPSNYYHFLDVRHGPMLVLGNHSVVIAAMSDAENKYERDLVDDIKKKGCFVIVLSDTDAGIDGTLNIFFGKKLHHAARGLLTVLVAQLLTLHKAEAMNVDPDRPGHLKSWIEL